MKKIFLTTLVVLVTSCSVPEVPLESLVERNQIAYQVNSDKPFSGKGTLYHFNGQIEVIDTYKNGIRIKTEVFQENGIPNYKEYYYENMLIGEEYYYDNGQLEWKYMCEGSVGNDICPYEEYYEYYENGQLGYKEVYKNGELAQEEAYYENGKKKQ